MELRPVSSILHVLNSTPGSLFKAFDSRGWGLELEWQTRGPHAITAPPITFVYNLYVIIVFPAPT